VAPETWHTFRLFQGMTPAIRKILLPTDFGPSSERTAAYAGALARRLGASVHLLHVVEEPLPARGARNFPRTDKSGVSEQLYHDRCAKLAALAAATLQHDTDRITLEVRAGTPADAIVDAAVAYGMDLIVMSAPAGRRLPSLMMDSVAERVLHAAPCPVLAVRPSGAARVHAGKQVA
jgi:nucleotide-binding universal stress UspA family protein